MADGKRPGRGVQCHRQGPPCADRWRRVCAHGNFPLPVPVADAAAGIWRQQRRWVGRGCRAPSSSSSSSCYWRSRCTAPLRGRPPPPHRTVSTVRTMGHRAARSVTEPDPPNPPLPQDLGRTGTPGRRSRGRRSRRRGLAGRSRSSTASHTGCWSLRSR